MDHVYNSIASFYDTYFQNFMEYQIEGNYKKLTDNPMYNEMKALIDAMNIIGKHLGLENIKLSEEVKWKLQNEPIKVYRR